MPARCGKIYRDLGHRHLCFLPPEHIGACRGYPTSEDLVPEHATRIHVHCPVKSESLKKQAIARGLCNFDAFVWRCEDIPDTWMAYAPPPHDMMAQGYKHGGCQSAIESLQCCIVKTEIERERRFAC
jgi:hypothetical protein